MKKIIVMLAFCLLSVSLFAQTGDVLNLEDATALYEGDVAENWDGRIIIDIIKELVSEGINDYCPSDGYTPLMYATQYGYTEIVKSLIAEGADVNADGRDGSTVLMCAAQGGHTESVKLLIEAGADVNASNYPAGGFTVLMLANSPEVVKLLLEAGAYIEDSDSDGRTALIWAAWIGKTEVLKLLIDAGANIERISYNPYSDGKTALMWAAEEGETEAVKILIEAGANLDVQNRDGETALILATEEGHTEIVNLLTETANPSYTIIHGTEHNYYEVPYVGEKSRLTKITKNAQNTIIEKYKFPTTVNDFLDDGNSITGKLVSVYREDIPNESDDTALSVYRLMYTLSTSDSNGMAKTSFIEGEGTERQSYGQALYIVNSDETNAELFSRDIYFGNQDLSGASSLGVIGNNTYFKVIDDTVISVMYELQSSTNQKAYNHEAIIYRNKIEDIQDKTELCQVEAPFPLIDKNNPYRYTIQNAFDGNPATSFVEDTEDDLMSIRFDFTKDYTFTDIAIINGYAQSENLYYVNNQVKRINFFEANTEYEHSYNLDGNTLAHQEFAFENSITQSSATIDVTEIYAGSKYSDTCLAELDIKTDEGWLFGLE